MILMRSIIVVSMVASAMFPVVMMTAIATVVTMDAVNSLIIVVVAGATLISTSGFNRARARP